MKKLLVLWLLSSVAWATTPVTGNLADLSGTAVASRSKVRLWLRGCGGNQPRVIGTSLVAPTNGNSFYFDLVPNGSGVLSGTVYSNNVNISCGGQVGVTWYGMQVFVNGTPGPETCLNAVDGMTLNLNSATACSASPVVPAPTGDGTYCRLDAGNCGFTGTPTLPGGTNVVGRSTTDTLTNKNLVGTSSGNKVTKLCFLNNLPPVTGTGADIAFFTCTIPANTLAISEGVRISVAWQHTTGTAAIVYHMNCGATVFSNYGSIADASSSKYSGQFQIWNLGSATAAKSDQFLASNITGFIAAGTSWGTGLSCDFSNTVNITLSFNVANTDAVTPDLLVGELIH